MEDELIFLKEEKHDIFERLYASRSQLAHIKNARTNRLPFELLCHSLAFLGESESYFQTLLVCKDWAKAAQNSSSHVCLDLGSLELSGTSSLHLGNLLMSSTFRNLTCLTLPANFHPIDQMRLRCHLCKVKTLVLQDDLLSPLFKLKSVVSLNLTSSQALHMPPDSNLDDGNFPPENLTELTLSFDRSWLLTEHVWLYPGFLSMLQLQSLDLSGCGPRVKPGLGDSLVHMHSLRCLNVAGCLDGKELTFLTELVSLEELVLGSRSRWITDEKLSCLAALPSLMSLELRGCPGVKGAGLSALLQLQTLTLIHDICCRSELDPFCMPKLTKLVFKKKSSSSYNFGQKVEDLLKVSSFPALAAGPGADRDTRLSSIPSYQLFTAPSPSSGQAACDWLCCIRPS
jgi:hypothetical protein